MGLEPALDTPPKPNGKHFCTEKAVIEKMLVEQTEQRTMLSGIASTMRGISEQLGDVGAKLISLDSRIGGVDPNDPTRATGLIGAVQRLTNEQLEQRQELRSVRPRLDSLEETEITTAIQSRDELIARCKAAESKLEKTQERSWALMAKIVVAVVSGGGLAGLAKILLETLK